jgi:flagellar hook-length control protein FliK
MGQAQNQLNLDDLFGSSKAVTGNFGRSRSQSSVLDDSGDRKPSFSEVLLKNLDQKSDIQKPKVVRSDAEARPNNHSKRDLEVKTAAPQPKSQPSQAREASSKNKQNLPSNPSRLSSDQASHPDETTSRYQTDERDLDQPSLSTAQPVTSSSNANQTQSNRENTTENKVDPALVPLQKQFDKKLTTDAVINNNAILAFITGRLDKLQPNTLPSLLSDSPLIKQVLGSENVGKFLESPTSINELANLLELDQNLLAGAARDGLNPSEFVKPKDFIKALGIDPNQVASELINLKQTLPTEGVDAYIDRAQAMTALKQNGELAPQAATVASKRLPSKNISEAPRPTIDPNTNIEVSQDKVMTPEQSLAAAITGNPFVQAKANITVDDSTRIDSRAQTIGDVDSVLAKFMPSTTVQEPTNNNFKDQTPDALQMNSLLGDFVRSDVNSKIQPTENPESALEQAFRAGVNPMAAGLGSSQPKGIELVNASDDPFAAMSQEIDSTTSTKIEFSGNGLNNRTLEEMLIERNASAGVVAKSLESDRELRSTKLDDKSAELTLDNLDNSIFEAGLARESIDSTITLGDASSMSLFNESGQSFSEGSDSSSFQDNSENATANVIGEKSTSLRESTVSFASKISPTSSEPMRESLAQKILGQAEMMFKNGGGSMRMDVEAPGIGKVDVAINLNNNQLDVRIMTASDQARDIISREVAGLRDGLTQQGLNLRGLEVGKAGESSSRQFAGQGNQHFGQGAQDQKATYNDMKEYVQSFRNSYAPRNTDRFVASRPTLGRWNNLAVNSGSRLEVRV